MDPTSDMTVEEKKIYWTNFYMIENLKNDLWSAMLAQNDDWKITGSCELQLQFKHICNNGIDAIKAKLVELSF